LALHPKENLRKVCHPLFRALWPLQRATLQAGYDQLLQRLQAAPIPRATLTSSERAKCESLEQFLKALLVSDNVRVVVVDSSNAGVGGLDGLSVYDRFPCIWEKATQALTLDRKLFHRRNIHLRLRTEMDREQKHSSEELFVYWQPCTNKHCACLQSTIMAQVKDWQALSQAYCTRFMLNWAKSHHEAVAAAERRRSSSSSAPAAMDEGDDADDVQYQPVSDDVVDSKDDDSGTEDEGIDIIDTDPETGAVDDSVVKEEQENKTAALSSVEERKEPPSGGGGGEGVDVTIPESGAYHVFDYLGAEDLADLIARASAEQARRYKRLEDEKQASQNEVVQIKKDYEEEKRMLIDDAIEEEKQLVERVQQLSSRKRRLLGSDLIVQD
jgi:hypothetical protein